MLVSSLPITPQLASLPGTAAGERGSNTERSPGAKAPLPSAAEAATSTNSAPVIAKTDTVTLSASPTRGAISLPAPIYAEIWRDGMKVAEVDSHGSVVPLGGSVAANPGGATGGPWLAAIRAVQVAQSVGGEIRVAGQAVDAGTLKMRARLETTYGR